ncbi:unnamed protein product [Phytophthora lilii]|uniref:Unnamed protein product n=1 Tax=Phytophthora lilii TaxID=2077276 RepID=A0A9W6WWD8_9STRA|nr:unnamed protein product [Phytophthora lilii]
MFCIVINSVVLAAADFSVVDDELNPTPYGKKLVHGEIVDAYSRANHVIKITELVLTVVFTAECALKIIALGIVGKGSYWRDSWNVADFFMLIAR